MATRIQLKLLVLVWASALSVCACGSDDTGGGGGPGASGGAGAIPGTGGTSAGGASASGGTAGQGAGAGQGGFAGAGASGGAAGSAGAGGSAGAPNGKMQFLGDFESGTLDGWSASGNDTTTVVKSPVRSGQFAAFMQVGPTDKVPYRTELVAGNEGVFHDGTEYWIGLSLRIVDWGAQLPKWATLFQTHAVPHAMPNGKPDWSCNAGKNSITVTTSGNQMRLNVVVNPDQSKLPGTAAIATEVWKEPFKLGVWVDWVFRYRPSTSADGIIEAWRDGQKIYSQTGANRFVLDNCNLPASPRTYMKVGIYREKANTSIQKLNYDEVRIFAGTNGYSAVAPK